MEVGSGTRRGRGMVLMVVIVVLKVEVVPLGRLKHVEWVHL